MISTKGCIYKASIVCCIVLSSLLSGYNASTHAADNPLSKFKNADPNPPQRYKHDNTADDMENIKVIELLKRYAKTYTPIPIANEPINSMSFTFGTNNWHASYGRQYFISDYEIILSAYINQVFGTLDEVEPLIIYHSDNTSDDTTHTDLEYTLTTFGISSSMYYLTLADGDFSLGFEVPLFALGRLSIDSHEANKSYAINGITLLGFPIWRHTNIVPVKARYQAFDSFALLFSLHYASFEIWQRTKTDPGDEIRGRTGEWFEGCDAVSCTVNRFIPALGIEFIF